jgi:dTDP-4-amino-4,6-dideoxygalactose transaminase
MAERAENAAYLDESLSEVPGVRLLRRDPRHTTRSFYKYIFAISPEAFGGVTNKLICRALWAEGVPCWWGYDAMHRYDLFQPQKSKLPVPMAFPERFNFAAMSFPETERASEREAIWLDEAIFRAGHAGIDDTVNAIKKIQARLAADADAVARIQAMGDD